jgi:uncharacterized protein
VPRPPQIDRGVGDRAPGGFAGQLLGFADELRQEGLAVGTSEILDSFRVLDLVPWSEQREFREGLAATLAKSPEDRRVFELVFDRFFFRTAEAEARVSSARTPRSTSTRCASRLRPR